MEEAVFRQWFLWISLVISLPYLSRLLKQRSTTPIGRPPPGPKPLPFIGSLLEIRGDNPHQTFARLAKRYGPVMSLKLGQVTTVIISSPDMAREVLHTNDLAFSSRSVPDAIRAFRHHEVSMAWMPVNQQWRNLRRICNTRLFTSQSLDAGQSLRRQKVGELISYVSECCASQMAVDVGRVAFTTSLNLISNTIFSVDFVSLKSESSKDFKDLIHESTETVASPNLADFFPWLGVLDPQGKRRGMTAYFKKIHAIFDQFIDGRLKAMSDGMTSSSTKSHADFLDALLLCDGGTIEFKLDSLTIKSLFADLFAAGSDTSSITVEWAMAELLRNPEAMARAREEIQSVIEPGKEVEESDISKLGYLQAVVKETLRLHPPAPMLLPRKTERATELGGYVVPEGARVLVNIWAIGRDSQVWPRPDVFMPERFLDEDIDFRGRNFELIPFGAGRRICPGLSLGLRMVHLMLASMLQSFEWKLPDGMTPAHIDMSERFGIALAMALPLRAIPLAT